MIYVFTIHEGEKSEIQEWLIRLNNKLYFDSKRRLGF